LRAERRFESLRTARHEVAGVEGAAIAVCATVGAVVCGDAVLSVERVGAELAEEGVRVRAAGIEAVEGVIDGGGNKASGNGNPSSA
jgi:hypothetical protein